MLLIRRLSGIIRVCKCECDSLYIAPRCSEVIPAQNASPLFMTSGLFLGERPTRQDTATLAYKPYRPWLLLRSIAASVSFVMCSVFVFMQI